MKKLIGIAVMLLATLAAAQDLVTVTATNIQSRPGVLLPSGQITFQPANSDGASIGYRIGGAGQVTKTPVVCTIVAGVITGAVGGGTCQLANTDTTSPLHVCFRTTVKNAAGIPVLGPTGVPNAPASGYECLQPAVTNSWCTAAVCNFDSYSPLGVATSLLSPGPTGATGATGSTGPTGAAGVAGGSGKVNTVSDASVPSGNSSGSGSSANAALTTAMSTYSGQTLTIPSGSVHHITADLVITNPTEIGGGGGFYVDSGKKLTLWMPAIPLKQVFFGPGTVTVFGASIFPQWYGVANDGTTDACTTGQKAIDSNPGQTIWFPMIMDTTSNPIQYTKSCEWLLSVNGTKLAGLGPKVKWTGGIKIRTSVSGVRGVKTATTCASCGVENLFFEGVDLASSTDTRTYEDFTALTDVTGSTGDCIEFNGGEPWAVGVRCSSFKGNGIHVKGSPGQPDIFHIQDLFVDYNRGFGVLIEGADSNVGLTTSLNAIGNQLGAWADFSFYGSTLNVAHTSLNARNGVASGSSLTVTTTSVASNVKTITSTAHGVLVGQWVTDTGSGDTTYNGTCKATSVTTNTILCSFTHANGSTSGGTVHTSSGTEIFAYYLAHGIKTGSIVSVSCSTIESFYEEGNQSSADIGDCALGVGGIHHPGLGNWIYGTSGVMNFKGKFFIFHPSISGGGLYVRDTTDTVNNFSADPQGLVTAKGNVHKFGAGTTGANNGLNIDNAQGLYIQKSDHTANYRMAYVHSDNIGHLCDSTIPCKIDTANFQTTGIRSNTSGNTDIAGSIAISAATSNTYTFAQSYVTSPVCTVTPTSDPTAVGVWWASASTTTLTVTIKTSGTITFNYQCVGRT